MLRLRIAPSGAAAVLAALSRSLGLIEFTPDGRVITANDTFCGMLGYSLSEIKGKHHKIFVDPEYAASREYREFWLKLGRGEYNANAYKRIAKDGREVWIQASYSPVMTRGGRVLKIVKQATDVTAQKLKAAEDTAIRNAIS